MESGSLFLVKILPLDTSNYWKWWANMTEYGKLLLKTQRDANLIAIASLQLQAAMTKEKHLIDLILSLGERVTKTCEEVNDACDFT